MSVVNVERSNAVTIQPSLPRTPTDLLNSMIVENNGIGLKRYEDVIVEIQSLLNKGADINNTLVDGNTPFIRAALANNSMLIRILDELGANNFKKNKEGKDIFRIVYETPSLFTQETRDTLRDITEIRAR